MSCWIPGKVCSCIGCVCTRKLIILVVRMCDRWYDRWCVIYFWYRQENRVFMENGPGSFSVRDGLKRLPRYYCYPHTLCTYKIIWALLWHWKWPIGLTQGERGALTSYYHFTIYTGQPPVFCVKLQHIARKPTPSPMKDVASWRAHPDFLYMFVTLT